jgi:glycosyltransferase involved in cell wall biosynthesis
VTAELPGPPLRIAVLGDFEGPHTRAWLSPFVQRGHDVHAISYYPPQADLPGVTVHVLSSTRGDGAPSRSSGAPSVTNRLPPSLLRLVHALRYRRAGLRRVLDEIRPDVFHAHYTVEHGFYGALAGYHPYVISAWGSDLLVESRTPMGKRIAAWALRRADLVTGNDASLVQRAVELGVPPDKTALVHLGIEPVFLDAGTASVNLAAETSGPPTVISDRALEPLYNVDTVLQAFATSRSGLPNAELVVAGRGRREDDLRRQADRLGLDGIVFTGHLAQSDLAAALALAHVYVSVPSSDSLALSNLEAMAAGAFPIVADLPSVDGWIEDGVNGLRVPPGDVVALANAIRRALSDPELRRNAAIQNRQLIEAHGLREPNMRLMERHYYRLAGHPVADEAG